VSQIKMILAVGACCLTNVKWWLVVGFRRNRSLEVDDREPFVSKARNRRRL
jgi:hypothetical protein